MKLPNGDYAVTPRVFASALGITAENADDLRELIVKAAIEGEVVQ